MAFDTPIKLSDRAKSVRNIFSNEHYKNVPAHQLCTEIFVFSNSFSK